MKRVIGEGRPRPVRRFALLVPVTLLLVAMASMQLGAAFAKGLFPRVEPQGATALRLTFSALILAAVRRPWRDLRLGRSALPLVAYGVSLGAMNTLFYMALRTVPLREAARVSGPMNSRAMATPRGTVRRARRRLDRPGRGGACPAFAARPRRARRRSGRRRSGPG